MGTWQCPVCTYDNDDSLLSCDICGVFKELSRDNGSNDENKVDGMYKDTGISILAKSLLTRNVPGMPQRNNGFLSGECYGFFKNGKKLSWFDALHKQNLATNHSSSIKIVPFSFDTPSPDDKISNAKKPRIASKVVQDIPSISSSITDDKRENVKFLPNNKKANTYIDGGSDECESSSARNYIDESQIARNLNQLKLDKKSTKTTKAMPLKEYKPEKWILSDQEEALSQLTLAIVGHVDSGKSTLSGRLLHLLGKISKKAMHKYEKEAKEKGKGSFAYARAMDKSYKERERDMTRNVALAYFESKKYRVVLLDSPGHKDFVSNMISGATQADTAILVIDASIGSFEAGMEYENGIIGQTREHAQLIRSFGIEHIIVAVNKMDMVIYSKERFDSIKSQLGTFFRLYGFKESNVTWIPLSAMKNQNLITPASDVRLSCWYRGLCLLDAVDSLLPPQRDILKPCLLPICDTISSPSLGQVAASGKLDRGGLKIGSKVLVMPSGDLASVRAIERDSSLCTIARAGDNVSVSLKGIDRSHVIPGGVLCHPDYPVNLASLLELKILVLEIKSPILIGSQVEFHIHHAKTVANLTKVVSLVDQRSGKQSKRIPPFLTEKQSALIEVSLDEAVCVEEFSSCRTLGRVLLRAAGNTIAVGIVTRVIQ